MNAGLRLLVFVFFSIAAHAQVTVIEGTLTDAESNGPIPYASIEITGYSIGTSSNTDGTFTLKIPEELAFKNVTIKITCIGYENKIIEDPSTPLLVRLKPTTTYLREIIFSSDELTPDGIVKKAFNNVRRNYNTKPFMYHTFYRHYCKDDGQYGRLIEAAVDIYKRKGYKVFQPYAGAKDEVKVMQLRRTFDNTKVTINHAPIALYSIMTVDEVAYQNNIRSNNPYWVASMGDRDVSALNKYHKLFDFTVDRVTSYDNEEVYKISYRLKTDSLHVSPGVAYPISYTGVLYINTRNFAFIRTEVKKVTPFDTLIASSSYKRNRDKYYLYHSMREGNSFNKQLNIAHQYHIELMTTSIQTRNFLEFKGKEPGKEILFNVPYDSAFWVDYNVIKATPLEEKIVADLERTASLENQFQDYSEIEKERFFSGQEDEERFNDFLKVNKGRVMYIGFWEADCGACLRELEYLKKLTNTYKRAVAFVLVSLDPDIQHWKEAIKKHKLVSPYVTHFRIGDQSDAEKAFTISQVPRYVLVNKKGFFADQKARQPTDPDLEKDIERLLSEEN